MTIENGVWIFSGHGSFPGGVFTTIEKAEKWIDANGLTGILTQTPVDEGVFDWAARLNLLNLRPEKIEEKSRDPKFIGGFSTASQEHYHYENGSRV
jgi:hypothetical protein